MDLRVWPGCLACYNAGRLVGEWVDAIDAAEWRCPVNPTHEEFQCLDHEIPWLSGEPSAAEATEWAEAVADVSEEQAEAFTIFAKMQGWSSPSDVDLSAFEDQYCGGGWESPEAYAWDYLSDTTPHGETYEAPTFFRLQFNETDWQMAYTFESGHIFRNE